MSSDPTTEDRIDAILAEYADRLSSDADPAREDLLGRHPALRAELERLFAMIEAASPRAAGTAPLDEGLCLGDYRLLRQIGRGGMGVVYLAEQESLGRRVAVKVLRPHLTLEPRHLDRFRREARAAARLRHPHVVAVHEVGEHDGHHYIAMDWVEGATLAGVIRRLADRADRPTAADLARETGRSELARCNSYAEACLRLMLPILAGVQAAHDAGLVHRDLKPGNVLLDRKGEPLVADFGLAKGEGDLALSLTGEPIGTPYYMSPEQATAASRGVDARTDVYSLGVVLYELLTLRVPFRGRTAHEVIQHILTDMPPTPRTLARDVPRPIESIVLTAMARRPEDRYADARELAEDLDRALRGVAVRARGFNRLRFAAEILGSLAIGGLAGASGSEYRSQRTLWGWPLVHIVGGRDPVKGTPRIARGLLAIGPMAVGLLPIGGLAIGPLAMGGAALGLPFCFGGLALGILAFGGMAAGGISLGGFSAGIVALGGQAVGYIASGGKASGTHVLDPHQADAVAVEFLQTWAPWWLRMFGIDA
ncbi:MAG: serine/threonine-protein kinase [Planctomycetota bacterium]|jgi:serine/threonine protein kinase